MPSILETQMLDPAAQKNVQAWLDGNYDPASKEFIKKQLEENPQAVEDAFYCNLDFGTGGLRGLMGIGTNRMNLYTVRLATQGLANYLLKQHFGKRPAVFIGYDTRENSKEFAQEAALVLAANQIEVYLCKEFRPVPFISFGCRLNACNAAIMITASHNPPEYNGYKVYWGDGCQVLPPHDKGIIEEVRQISSIDQVKIDGSADLIHQVDQTLDQAYLAAVKELQCHPEITLAHGDKLSIIYTSLHGTGIAAVPELLQAWGLKNIHYVKEQCKPHGQFPTAHSPNPEDKTALKLGMEVLEELQGDLLLATDPDCDRVGIVINHKGKFTILTGNQVACLLLDYLCQSLTRQKRMPAKAAFIKTIVTSELFKAIANHYGCPCFDVLTGFKYIGEKITEWEKDPQGYNFVFGGEESLGYLCGTHVRDKDAVISSALICEMALQAKLEGKTLIDRLLELYTKFGVFRESLKSVNYPLTRAGMQQLDLAMKKLRKNPLKAVLGTPVVCIEDYKTSQCTFFDTGNVEPLTLPSSDVLVYHLKDGTKLVIRPSGTEPKIKIYCGTVSKTFYSLDEGIEHCDVLAEDYLRVLESLLL